MPMIPLCFKHVQYTELPLGMRQYISLILNCRWITNQKEFMRNMIDRRYIGINTVRHFASWHTFLGSGCIRIFSFHQFFLNCKRTIRIPKRKFVTYWRTYPILSPSVGFGYRNEARSVGLHLPSLLQRSTAPSTDCPTPAPNRHH